MASAAAQCPQACCCAPQSEPCHEQRLQCTMCALKCLFLMAASAAMLLHGYLEALGHCLAASSHAAAQKQSAN